MNKLEFFLAAMEAQEFRRRAWVFAAFSVVSEAPDAWRQMPYPYRIVQQPTGVFFVNPKNPQELLPIEGCVAGEPPFRFKDHVTLVKYQVPNLLDHDELDTTYGNILFNYTGVIWPFSHNLERGSCKIPYQTGRVSASHMEGLIIRRLADDPKPGEEGHDPADRIFVSEYLKFCDAMFYLAGFTQLCVPASTPKSLVPAPGLYELRARLLEENKDRLHDASVVAMIQKQLIDYDRAYLKDDPSSDFLINSKSWNVVRSKQFGMHGAEMNTLTDSVDVKVIPTSLSEGWSIEHFPDYMNSLRGGTFGRSAQTQMGGESVKWLLRASSNITVTDKDCGTTMGIDFACTDKNFNWLVGCSVQSTTGPVLVSDEDAKSYIGRRLVVRSPMYCQLDKTDYCQTCVGERLAANPTALSTSISDYGSTFLGIFMSAVHGKQLQVAKLDVLTAIQ